MKTIIFALAICLCGCKWSNPKGVAGVETYDGCEYIYSYGYLDYKSYAHKGNCKNPVHKIGY